MKGGRPCTCNNCMKKRGNRSYSAPRVKPIGYTSYRTRKIGGETFKLLPLGGNAAREYLGQPLYTQGTFDSKDNMRRKASWYRQQGYNARVIELANGHTLWISEKRTLVPTQIDRIRKEFQARFKDDKLGGEVAWKNLISSSTGGRTRSMYWANNNVKTPLYNRRITPGNQEFDELQGFSADMLMRLEGRAGNARERAILLNEEVVRRQAGADPQYIFLDYVDYADGVGSSTLEPRVKQMRGTEGEKFYDDMLGVLFPAFWGRSFNEGLINSQRGMQLFDPEWNFVNDGGDSLYRMPNGDMVNTDEDEAMKAGGVLLKTSFVEALREMVDAKDGMGIVGYDGYIENVRTGEQLGLDDINARMGGGMSDMGRQFFDTVQSYESGLYGDVMPENYELANYFLSMPSGFESFIVAEPTDRAITGETMITQVGKMGSGVNQVVVSKNVILNDLDTWIQPNDFGKTYNRWVWIPDEEDPMKKRIGPLSKQKGYAVVDRKTGAIIQATPGSSLKEARMQKKELQRSLDVMNNPDFYDLAIKPITLDIDADGSWVDYKLGKRTYNHPRWFVTPTPPSDVNDGNSDGIHDDFQGE